MDNITTLPANMRTLSRYEDGVELIFSRGDRVGKFTDDYRVSFRNPNGALSTLTDEQIFSRFLAYQDNQRVFQAVLLLAAQIDRGTENLSGITVPRISGDIEERKLFEFYAACLIAEEHKRRAKTGELYPLGKKVKLIGAYELLKLGRSTSEAANSTKKKFAEDLLKRYREYGLPGCGDKSTSITSS